MKISLNWLKEIIPFDVSMEQLAHHFTTHAQEVESVGPLVPASGLVIGQVKTCTKHPQADSLSVCTVDVKTAVLTIVCGASNVAADQTVIVALPNANLPNGHQIEKTVIRGVASEGMICSLSELGIEYKYHHEDGIHVLREAVEPGTDALQALAFDDAVLVLDLTPNRADLLSMHGVAYDVAAMLDLPLELPVLHVRESGASPVQISTETPRCQSYYGRVLESIVIAPSPAFMQARLIAAGIRPINNVVDITNYVMLETGQPLHAFDFSALDSKRIVVREAQAGETFVTLDDKKRQLHAGDILITNGSKPVALGGVMGGADTEVQTTTTQILLESAVFDAVSVGKTSRRLDLRSESSLRFERKVDPEKTLYALNRATELFIRYAGATIVGTAGYFDHTETTQTPIQVSLEKINGVLGGQFSLEYVNRLLKRLRLPYSEQAGLYAITPVSRRQDLLTYQDIIEEIGRISGYDQLPNTLPKTLSQGSLTKRQLLRRTIRNALTGLGLDEVVTYSLQAVDKVARFTLESGEVVRVADPMTDLHECLVQTPLTGVYDVAKYNAARKQADVNIFEIGKCYALGQETERLAILMMGTHHHYRWQGSPVTDFYTLKGVFEALLDTLGLPAARYQPYNHPDCHPHQAATIHLHDRLIGFLGKVHPTETAADHLSDVFILDVDVSALLEGSENTTLYRPLQKYPAVERDLALICPQTLPAQTLLDTIASQAKDLAVSLDIFDVYTGANLEEGTKSLGIRIVLADPLKTLEAKTIDAWIEGVVETLEALHGVIRR